MPLGWSGWERGTAVATWPAPSTQARATGSQEEPWLTLPGFLWAKPSHWQVHFTSDMEVLTSPLLTFILPAPHALPPSWPGSGCFPRADLEHFLCTGGALMVSSSQGTPLPGLPSQPGLHSGTDRQKPQRLLVQRCPLTVSVPHTSGRTDSPPFWGLCRTVGTCPVGC